MKIKIRRHSYWKTRIVLHGDLAATNILEISRSGIYLYSGIISGSGLSLTERIEIEVDE